jgi:hypothetical protein
MDPVTIGAVLAALVGGVGGALGSDLWAEVSALARRPFRHANRTGGTVPALPDGSAELAALEEAPGDERRARILAEVLVARTGTDEGFREALEAWWERASRVQACGDVVNTISGGTQYGPVLQGHDFADLTFGSQVLSGTPPAQDSST